MNSVKRILVTVVGGTILLIGVTLLVLPGPAFLVIPLGLAILATEYVWARRWLKRAKNMTNKRKAQRTTRVLRQALERRWTRFRWQLARWLPGWFPPPPSLAKPDMEPSVPEDAGESAPEPPSASPSEGGEPQGTKETPPVEQSQTEDSKRPDGVPGLSP